MADKSGLAPGKVRSAMNLRKRLFVFALLLLTLSTLAVAAVFQASSKSSSGTKLTSKSRPRSDESYPYKSKQFTAFVDESFKIHGKGEARDFYTWIDSAYKNCKSRYPGKQNLTLVELGRTKKNELSHITNPAKKAQAEVELAAWTHKTIKATIKHFSLDRGFEFYNTVAYGERQCFLQSVLIAGLLQNMGMDAGVEMVYKNPAGQESNNGHAVVLLKLSNGRDILVDASEPEPFPQHQGLFVITSDYHYVRPVYDKKSSQILYYLAKPTDKKLATQSVRTLGTDFLRSQFYYYRGERTVGGAIAAKKTATGLTSSERFLQTGVKACPQNPLAVYMLGKVLYAENKTTAAKKYALQAHTLYTKAGWIPSGPREFLNTFKGK